jgi:PHP family Zn ribbon phosphoesterase
MIKADLHVHTCLSPCAEIVQSPRRVAAEARRRELDVIGICDHNSAENAAAAATAAARAGIRALPGMEITSREEVHLLALFDDIGAALALQERIYAALPGENDPDVFGLQVVADAEDEVLGFNTRFLAGATTLSLADLVASIHALGGLAVAAHADREGFGIVGQLGFVPDDLALDALEISPHMSLEEARRTFGARRPLITSSDAHDPERIGRTATLFWLEDGTAAEIGLALQGRGDRRIVSWGSS